MPRGGEGKARLPALLRGKSFGRLAQTRASYVWGAADVAG